MRHHRSSVYTQSRLSGLDFWMIRIEQCRGNARNAITLGGMVESTVCLQIYEVI